MPLGCARVPQMADGLQGYRFDPKSELPTSIRISYAKAKGARPPPRAPPPRFDDSYSHMPREGGLPREPPREPPSREEHRDRDRDRYDDRYEDEGRGGYDDDRRYESERGRGGYRRDAREHHDGYREDYEDSELGDDVFQRAEQVSMHGVTDT